jgi:hypothetical protein
MGASFVLSDDFNEIRRFIRYNEGDKDVFFRPNDSKILYDGIQSTNGHLITVEQEPRGAMFAKVSLFNLYTYRVILRSRLRIILLGPFSFGHHFDVPSGEITNLHRSYQGMPII